MTMTPEERKAALLTALQRTPDRTAERRAELQREVDRSLGRTPEEILLRELLEVMKTNEIADARHQEEVENLLRGFLQKIETTMPGHKQVEAVGMMLGYGLILLFTIALILGAIHWRLG